MLRIITAPVRSDLSLQTVSEMVGEATKSRDRKFVIIVPEQFTLRTQQRVVELHPRHACMNIDVVSFDRLAHVVLAKLGRETKDILDDSGKALILRKVLEDIRNDLKVYAGKIHSAGFVEETKSLITEFKQYGIDDNDLYLMGEAAGENGLLYRKIQDIRLIFRAFNKAIEEKYITSEEVLDVFARYLPESDFLTGSSIYLDGFTGFTPIQYRIIARMLKVADVTCSISAARSDIREGCPEYDLFALPSETFFRLTDIAREEGCEVSEVSAAGLSDRDLPVQVTSCSDIRDEAAFTASQILRIVRQKGVRFRDIGVLTTDMEAYHTIVAGVFESAGIPTFIDYKTEFRDNLLVRFIMSALTVSAEGLDHEQVFTFLKTGFAGGSPDEIALLENYCLEFNIRGRARWEAPFTANRTLRSGADAFDLEKLNDIKAKIIPPLLNFHGRTSRTARPAKMFCMCIRKLLEEYSVKDRIDEMAHGFEAEGELALALQYGQIHDEITELLDKAETILGQEPMTASEFAGMIENGAGEIRIGTIPPSIDALVVGDLTRTRLGDISHLFVMGMNDGRIPSAGSGSALFTQKERELLRTGFEIAPTVLENLYVQRYYLTLAFNKPSDQLYLTYPTLSVSGEQLSPSCILEDLDELIPGFSGSVKTVHNRDEDELWRESAFEMAASDLRRLVSGGEVSESAVLEYLANAEPDVLRLLMSGAFYTNSQSSLDKRVAMDLYGEVLHGSVSRYETYFMCPYRHFLNYGLRLEKRREYQVEATDLGTIYHDALERYSKRILEEGYSFRDISDDDSHRIIGECVNEAIENIGNDILSSSSRNEHFKKRIAQISSRTTDIIREHVKAGLFEPEEFEYSFNEKLSDDVVFKGKIDRIDIYDSGDIFVKIIDYFFFHAEDGIRDIYSGLQLQLVAYADSAVKEIRKKNPGRNVVPGGIYYYLVNDSYVKPDAVEGKNRMSGLTLAEDDIIHAMDTELASGDKSNIIPVTLTGSGISSRSIIADRCEFSNLIRFVSGRITQAGEAIKSGDINLSPYRENDSHNGCSFCDYKDICRFEPGQFGTDWRELEKDDNEIRETIYGGNEMD